MVSLLALAVVTFVAPFSQGLASPIAASEQSGVSASFMVDESGMVTEMSSTDAFGPPRPPIRASVQSDWKFSCPRRGILTKTLTWRAVVNADLTVIDLTGMQGITDFERPRVFGTRFTAGIYSNSCVQINKLNCVYRVTGTMIGEVQASHLALGLITDRRPENPSVEEACLDAPTLRRPDDCPAFADKDFKTCVILSTNTKAT